MSLPHKHYHFTTIWTFTHPIEKVWEELVHAERWPTWWKGVKEAEILHVGDNLTIGSKMRFAWQSILPYKLRFIATTTEVKLGEMIKGTAEGDLDGTGTWYFSHDNSLTTLRYEWDVSTTKPWMNLLAPIGKPFFTFAHNHLMKEGEKSLRALLEKN